MRSSLKKYFLKKYNFSAKQIEASIANKLVYVNGSEATINQTVDEFDTITCNNELIQKGKEKIYIAYYKPRGIESTLNKAIPGNLASALNLEERLFPLGRLDKESEGLMLLTNDGRIYNQVTHATSEKEKEYVVETNKPIDADFIEKLASGIEIMGKMTKPCFVKKIDETHFSIVLTQGLNRQIRRMCYKIGYEVISLVRVRIMHIHLATMQPGEYRFLENEEILLLKPGNL